MATHKVSSVWTEDMHFNTTVPPGVSIDIDAAVESGGKGEGLRPKPLMLAALAGCTAMDIASLLKKMRAEVRNFEVLVEGVLTEEHPKFYKSVHVEYRFYNDTFKKKKIEKSVNLSVERYCGVMEMFRSFAEVTTEIVYMEEKKGTDT